MLISLLCMQLFTPQLAAYLAARIRLLTPCRPHQSLLRLRRASVQVCLIPSFLNLIRLKPNLNKARLGRGQKGKIKETLGPLTWKNSYLTLKSNMTQQIYCPDKNLFELIMYLLLLCPEAVLQQILPERTCCACCMLIKDLL